MFKFKSILLILLSGFVYAVLPSAGCTSAIVSGKASVTGKPFIWKHRDTGTEHNFIEKVEKPGQITYIALFNGGDSLLRDAWMGMNEAGFMIMNTASYNLAPDTAKFVDQEGAVMRRALETCRTLSDFRNLLDTLPRPMGVQANFGVLDRSGAGGYFETDDYSYKTFLLNDTTHYIIRTNFSESGNDTDGYGYIRYQNASDLLGCPPFAPSQFTEGLSRSFYNSLMNKDFAADEGERWVFDQDFIPRNISTASILMYNGGENNDVMYANLGYPPVGELYRIKFDMVPDDVRPINCGWRAPACDRAIEKKRLAFPIRRGSGPHYIDMNYVRPVNEELRLKNMQIYYSDFEQR